MNNLNDLIKKLERLEKNAKKMEGIHRISIQELLTDEFMKENTNFDNFDEFLKCSKLDKKALKNIEETTLDSIVIKFTNFNSWEEMKSKALKLYTEKKLFKGVK